MYIKQIVMIVSLCVISSCASSPEQGSDAQSDSRRSGSDCIFKSSIRGYEVLDEANLIVSAGASRKYHLQLQRRAYGLRSTWGIGFESATNSVCAGFDEVVFQGNFDDESIRIASIRRLTAEEYDDTLVRFGKKEPEIQRTPPPADVEGAEVEELDPAANDL